MERGNEEVVLQIPDNEDSEGPSPAETSSSPNNRVQMSTTDTLRRRKSLKRLDTPSTGSLGLESLGGEKEDDEEVYKTANLKVREKSGKRLKIKDFTVWIAFACILGFLIASLTVHKLQNTVICGLELWKWVQLVLVIFGGRLVTEWFINFLVFLIERNFLLKKKVLYFVCALKKSVQVFIWLGLVLLAWDLLLVGGVKRSKRASQVLNCITRALAGCLIGAGIWLVKNLLVKLLASSFQSQIFFDQLQKLIFNDCVLCILFGPPLMKMPSTWTMKGLINVMKGLINVIRSFGLSTISSALVKDEEITELKAKTVADGIVNNVAKPDSMYIDKEDLLYFMKEEVVDNVLLLFEGAAQTRKIERKSLENWLVNVYLGRKSLALSLNDTKTAIEELNKLVSVIVLIVDIIVCLLLMGFLTTQILIFISSQLLLAVFLFGNTAKTVFEAIIFVFVTHPFDVDDCVVVDGVQMTVEEMNILTTIFKRYDNEKEKIFYPNSVLSTKPISKFNWSYHCIEFAVDDSTSNESIKALKARIKTYLESKPQHWLPGHNLEVKKIENAKMKMALILTHTIQDYGIRNSQRSELILELKKIFEELGIKFDQLQPQEVHLRYVGSALPAFQS